MKQRKVYRALHRPLTVLGVDRQMAICSGVIGGIVWQVTTSGKAGLLVTGLLMWIAWQMRDDAKKPLIIWSCWTRMRTRYDAGKHEPVEVRL